MTKRKPVKAKSKAKRQGTKSKPKTKPKKVIPRKSPPKKRAAVKRKRAQPGHKLRVSRETKAQREERLKRQRAGKKKAKREKKSKVKARRKRAAKLIPTEYNLAVGWLVDLTPSGATLSLTTPEAGSHGAWIVVGRYDFDPSLTYQELAQIFAEWEADTIMELKIGTDRIAQIRVVFHDPNIGLSTESFVSEAGPWAFLVSAMRHEALDLAQRYAKTVIPTMYLYFSSESQSTFVIG